MLSPFIELGKRLGASYLRSADPERAQLSRVVFSYLRSADPERAQLRVVFYWWTPDPTFLDVSPLSLTFPQHDALAFARGDLSTQSLGIDIRTIVSRDLGRLAPKVELFLTNMRLDLATINSLLLENKNLGESMSETVCRWIQGNEAEWESWIPDDTKCFPGFGLFDDASGDYVLDRDIPEGKRQGT